MGRGSRFGRGEKCRQRVWLIEIGCHRSLHVRLHTALRDGPASWPCIVAMMTFDWIVFTRLSTANSNSD